ncbi:MAG TPA: hypothetical protein VNH83_18555 [Bryobacteraceae bacterium]|nr:hypothetical protein [Bryobacteraceae bacterium]
MRRFSLLVAVSLVALSGCQSTAYVQFTVPQTHEARLISLLRSIGLRHGMADKTPESRASGTLVLMSEGDLSYTQLGARRYKSMVLVDLLFRSAGIGGQLYKQLEPEVTEALQQLYPGQVRIERDYQKVIRVHPNI